MKVNLKTPPVEKIETPEIVETAKELVKTEQGLAMLEGILKRSFTPEKINQLLVDLCQAEDIRMNKMGEEYRTPNWDARKNGLDRVLGMLKYTKKDAVASEQAATKIVFQIVNNPNGTATKPENT